MKRETVIFTGVLVIIAVGITVCLLLKIAQGLNLADTGAVDIYRAVTAPGLAALVGLFIFLRRNYRR